MVIVIFANDKTRFTILRLFKENCMLKVLVRTVIEVDIVK